MSTLRGHPHGPIPSHRDRDLLMSFKQASEVLRVLEKLRPLKRGDQVGERKPGAGRLVSGGESLSML